MTLQAHTDEAGARELHDPLEDLIRRGLVRLPTGPRTERPAKVKASGSVSELVVEQRR